MIILGVGSLCTSFFVVWMILKICLRNDIYLGLIASPNDEVLTHNKPIPILGGISIFFFVIPLLFLINYKYDFSIGTYLAGFIPIGLLGLYKDHNQKPFSPFIQLGIQIFSSFCLYRYWTIVNAVNPDFLSVILFVILCTVIINSFNFLDVVDGLAGSYMFIIIIIHGFMSIYFENLPYILLAFSCAGSIFAFLMCNWNPAKVFMGDLGSFGLIYTLLFIIIALYPESQINSFAGYFFIFSVPLFEFFFTVFYRGMQEKRPYIGDASHVSLLLLNSKSWSSSKIVFSATGIAFITNVIAVFFLIS